MDELTDENRKKINGVWCTRKESSTQTLNSVSREEAGKKTCPHLNSTTNISVCINTSCMAWVSDVKTVSYYHKDKYGLNKILESHDEKMDTGKCGINNIT